MNGRNNLVSILNEMADSGRQYQKKRGNFEKYVMALKNQKSRINQPPVEGALVMCTNAMDRNQRIPLVKDGYSKVSLAGLAELDCKDITLGRPFSGCKEANDKKCRVLNKPAKKREWKELDKSKSSGEGKEGLLSEDSYMICLEEYGIISIAHPGQRTSGMINKLDMFGDHLIRQFGFDQKTVEIIIELYVRVQEKYGDKSQRERDWYFTRAISQMGGYNSKIYKLLIDIETHAWEYGAGKIYDYDFSEEEREKSEKTYFCDTLGLEEEEYRYFRYMIRLQHFITSNEENKYSYDSVDDMIELAKNKEDFEIHIWMHNMEEGTGKKYSRESAEGEKTYFYEEYMSEYKRIHERTSDKGDFSHMMYTIAANLTNERDENGVKDQWRSLDVLGMKWENAEERGDIAGWLGDAVYVGKKAVSFGQDDYIADLDADNIVHRMHEEENFLDSINEYYQGMSDSGRSEDEFRTVEFLKNNPYENVQESILTRVDFAFSYKTEDGTKVYNDWADVSDSKNISYMLEELENTPKYEETYKFLNKLKTCAEGK